MAVEIKIVITENEDGTVDTEMTSTSLGTNPEIMQAVFLSQLVMRAIKWQTETSGTGDLEKAVVQIIPVKGAGNN